MSRDYFNECKAALALALHGYGSCWTIGASTRRDGEVWDAYAYVLMSAPDACTVTDIVVRSYASNVLCTDGVSMRMWYFNLKR